MTADLWDRSVEWGPDVPEADKMPNDRLEVPCDGTAASLRLATHGVLTDDNELVLEVDAGTTWRVAVGEIPVPERPAFVPFTTGEGALVLLDMIEPMLARDATAGGLGVQVPAGVTTVTALVQCSGAPLDIKTEAGEIKGTAACDDPSVTERFDFEVTDPSAGYLGVHAAADGFTWYRLAAEAIPGTTAARPTAPPLPDGLADVRFAEGDGSNVAFGAIGDTTQTVVAMEASPVGNRGSAGDLVVMGVPNGTGGTLELWRMSDATSLGTIAAVDDGAFFGAWVDPTHEQVFYGVIRRVGDEQEGSWHRVGFDGTGDTVIASVRPVERATFAQARLAADDSAFVAQWCLEGTCERAIHDAAGGETRRVPVEGDPACDLIGAGGGRIAFVAAPTCDGAGPFRTVTQPLDGGEATTVAEGYSTGQVIETSDGPAVLVLTYPDETHTVASVARLDGQGLEERWTGEHEAGLQYNQTSVRLPKGDWVLLGGPLGDTPGFASIGRPVPILLNVVTGETIELPNLPSMQ